MQSANPTTQSESPTHRASDALTLRAREALSADATRKDKGPPIPLGPARENLIPLEKENANPTHHALEKGNLRNRTRRVPPITVHLHPDRADIPSLNAPFPPNLEKESGVHHLERHLLKSPLRHVAKKAKKSKRAPVTKISKSTKRSEKPPSKTKPSTRVTA